MNCTLCYKDKDYCNQKLKSKIFQQFYNELNENPLIWGIDVKQLMARIKLI